MQPLAFAVGATASESAAAQAAIIRFMFDLRP